MDDDSLQIIEYQMAQLVRLISATRPRNPELASLDRSAYLILSELDGQPPIPISAIASRFKLDISTASRQIASMESKGLVTRTPDPADARTSLLTITKTGQARLTAMKSARKRVYQEILKAWTVEDIDLLADIVTRLANDIKNYKSGP